MNLRPRLGLLYKLSVRTGLALLAVIESTLMLRTLTGRSRAWLVLLALFLLPGPRPACGQDLKFIVFADSQAADWSPLLNTNVLEDIAQAIVDEKPTFVLFGGDLVNSANPGTTAIWTNTMGAVYAAGIPVYPAVGNHDKYAMNEFVPIFKPFLPDNGPEGEKYQTYFVQHQEALVVVLNAFNLTNELRLQQKWLDAVLATNTLPHVFVMAHPPAFKLKHLDCLGQYPAERNEFWQSLTRAGCRMYFCGHDHFFDHAHILDADPDPENDIHQFTVGTGGAYFYEDSVYDGENAPYQPLRVYHEKQYGYLKVEVQGYAVTARWYRWLEGGKFAATDQLFSYSVRPKLHLSPAGAQPRLVWSGNAQLQSSTEPHGTYIDIPNASSPYLLNASSEGNVFYRLSTQ